MHNQLSTDEVYKAFEQSLLSDASMRTAAEATIKQVLSQLTADARLS